MRPAHCSKTPLALLAMLLLQAAPALAECTCIWEGSFSDVQADADIVVAATVTQRKGNSVDLRLEEILRGQSYLDELRVWMATRDYCRPPAGEFPVDSRWVFALKRIREIPRDGFDPGTPNESFGRVNDYYLSSCGGYWLHYEGSAVTGNLVNAPRWAREVDMTPVSINLLRAFVDGRADAAALETASKEDPALKELLFDTKAFLRGQDPDQDPN